MVSMRRIPANLSSSSGYRKHLSSLPDVFFHIYWCKTHIKGTILHQPLHYRPEYLSAHIIYVGLYYFNLLPWGYYFLTTHPLHLNSWEFHSFFAQTISYNLSTTMEGKSTNSLQNVDIIVTPVGVTSSP